MRRAVLLAVAAAALGGCGNERTQPPDVVHADPPQALKTVIYDKAGVRFKAPGNWRDLPPLGSRVGGVQSKTATVAVWRYEREEPLPETDEALEEARTRLIDRVKLRDPTFEVTESAVTERGEAPAVELVGRQTIAGLPMTVRSSHIFKDGAEVVIDAYAPPDDFDFVDERVFRPLLQSIRVTKP